MTSYCYFVVHIRKHQNVFVCFRAYSVSLFAVRFLLEHTISTRTHYQKGTFLHMKKIIPVIFIGQKSYEVNRVRQLNILEVVYLKWTLLSRITDIVRRNSVIVIIIIIIRNTVTSGFSHFNTLSHTTPTLEEASVYLHSLKYSITL